ncbi:MULTISPECIES: class I SAM-dependent methyltransferase [unclassified Ruegeria]|uniref:class I SAM-dependent methyltransferase n=1 Tax=unclassified Ruegeria TaxID=2625375 RepID=UPI0014886FF8|nr:MULTISPECIES: SAM-dependent methyltransferase [unclassified Ruegeria]
MSLLDHLIERIAQDGPMTVAEYMSTCLLHPKFGYYATRDPLGQKGDFTTAPEISQMFGELIGLTLAKCWLDQGQPKDCLLLELGPGRGTLMADILRATQAVPGFHAALQVTLFEASPVLRAAQTKTLKGYDPDWIETLEALPDRPVFMVANEFFDALPIRQFVKDGDSWRERLIGSNGTTLSFGLGATAPQPALQARLDDTEDGDLVELCTPALPVIETLSNRIASHGGAGFIIDYGDWHSLGDTFQALRAHMRADPLECPGQADLTAHVDFEPLAVTIRAHGCCHTRLTPQGVFLERLGITARAQALASNLAGEALDGLIAAHRRLTHPDEMGNLFKVLGLYPQHAAPPPGLEP